jgi:hypothetical protein
MTVETILAIVDPFYEHPSEKQVQILTFEAAGRDQYEIPFYRGSLALATRFAVLPLMDVVCGNYGNVERVSWDEVENLVLASLPNFGQQKDLWYSDRVIWDLGLRDWGNIGFPEITNSCELYTMGGWGIMFIITILEFGAIFFWYMVMRRLLEYHILVIAVAAQFVVFATVTTTALSVFGYAVRGLPVTIGLIWIAKQAASAVVARPKQGMREPKTGNAL